MIYIKTKNGWYSTGAETEGEMIIQWNYYALAYWDSNKNNFVWPGPDGYYRSRGMTPIDESTKFQMWALGKDFPKFNERNHPIKHSTTLTF